MLPFITIFKSGFKIDKIVKESEATQIDPSLPKSLQVQYKPNHASFRNWMKNNRDHQATAIAKAMNESIGQVSLPTGTGKTRVQIALHVAKMIELTEANRRGVFVIGAHRLALCSQLLSEMIAIVVNAGLPFDILFVGCSKYPEDQVHTKFKNKGLNHYVMEATSTTASQEIADAYESATKNNRHLICVSTYHSFDKLAAIPEITMCTYDEAHTLIGEDFLANIVGLRKNIEFNYFFTATRKVQGKSEGMNNESIFGKVIHEEAARKMIQEGEIVPPKLHIIQTATEGDFNNHTMLVKTVIAGFEQHKALVKDNSANPDAIGAKLLVTTTGNKEMFELHNDPVFRDYCKENNITVFAFSSAEGIYHDFLPITRNEALDGMAKLETEEDAILLHIEILTEGIDLPSITGVMPFRELNTTKLLQTIGRGARLLKADRVRLYSGELAPMDWSAYIKPCCWVILPEHFRSLGNSQAMKNTIKDIVNTYDIPVEEYTAIDRYLAETDSDVPRITPRDSSNRRKDKETTLIHTVEDVMSERFSMFHAALSPIVALNKIMQALKD